jgi:Gram-negative bacterial TonB protein C-terminal
MMRSIALSFLLATVSVPTSATAEVAEVELPRKGPWQVNYDDNACHLLGQFGEGDSAIAIKLTRYQPDDHFDLMLYGKPLSASGLNAEVQLSLGSSKRPLKLKALAGHAGELPFLMIGGLWIADEVQNDSAAPALLSPPQPTDADSLVIQYGGKRYRLATGSLDKPFAALRTCQTDLVKFWGYDPDVQASLSKGPTPIGNPGRWASWTDFPSRALENRRSGRVKFRLDIDEAGKVTGCHVLEQTNPAEFGVLSCQILTKRGRFKPALDKDGKPVRSFWVSSVTWLA